MKYCTPTYCALCISRCGCIAELEDGVLTKIRPNPEHPTGQTLCIKGKSSPEILYNKDRILYPMRRTSAKGQSPAVWQRISWAEALDTIAKRLLILRENNGAEATVFGVTTPSATAIVDSFAWINRLAHAYGSPNILFASENCNWHKDFSPKLTQGQGIGMPDYENTGCIILWGFNPSVSWLAQAKQINKALKRGCKLIVIDPRKAGFAKRADEWLAVKPACDGQLAMALANLLIQKRWFDQEFIRDWSNGPFLVREDNNALLRCEDLLESPPVANSLEKNTDSNAHLAWDKQHQRLCVYSEDSYHPLPGELALFGRFSVQTTDGPVYCKPAFQCYANTCAQYPPESAEQYCGISTSQLYTTAKLIAHSGPISYFTWTGTAQQNQATQSARAINLLYALTGDIDAAGGNVIFTQVPTSNVLGMDLISEEQKQKALGKSPRPLGPSSVTWINSDEFYQASVKQQPYPVKALVSFGGNPYATKPQPGKTLTSLKHLDFYVHADMFMNPSAELADLFLPVASPWERSGLYPGFHVSQEAESRVQLRKPIVSPMGEVKSDTWIVFELAKRLGLKKEFFNGDERAALAHVLKPSGLSIKELEQAPQGINLGLKTRHKKYQQHGFATPSKKLEIYSHKLAECDYLPIPQFKKTISTNEEYPLDLICAKVGAYCHSQFRQIDSLKKRKAVPSVEVHPDLAHEYGFNEGDQVRIKSPFGSMQAQLLFNSGMMTKVVCADYGWQDKSHNYAELIAAEDSDEVSGSNRLRDCPCQLVAIADDK